MVALRPEDQVAVKPAERTSGKDTAGEDAAMGSPREQSPLISMAVPPVSWTLALAGCSEFPGRA